MNVTSAQDIWSPFADILLPNVTDALTIASDTLGRIITPYCHFGASQ